MLSKLPIFFLFFFLFPSFPPDSIYSVLNLSVSQLHLLLSFPSPHYKFTILFLAHHAPVYLATLGFLQFCLFHSLLVPPCFSLLEQTLTWIPTCSRPAPQNYVLINAKLIINSPTSLFVCFSHLDLILSPRRLRYRLCPFVGWLICHI